MWNVTSKLLLQGLRGGLGPLGLPGQRGPIVSVLSVLVWSTVSCSILCMKRGDLDRRESLAVMERKETKYDHASSRHLALIVVYACVLRELLAKWDKQE